MALQFHVTKILQDAVLVLDTKEFRDAIQEDLSSFSSPNLEKDSPFFESISIPYIHLKNAQYSLAIDAWEKILTLIKEIDAYRFDKMHKGTPYYFCGIAAYLLHDYERAVFYFDAALAEDVKNYPVFKMDVRRAPAILFLTLNDKVPNQAAQKLTQKTKTLIEKALGEFEQESSQKMDLAQLDNLFLSPSITKSSAWRSAVTALFSFVLESNSRIKEFSLKSAHGGTQETFFLHLFKGCLLFETLLKLSPKWSGDKKEKLGNVLQNLTIQSSLGISLKFTEVSNIAFDDIVNISKNWRANGIPFCDRVIWTTYGIRNTTGHNLSWETNMTSTDFENLADDILFAIFLAFLKLF